MTPTDMQAALQACVDALLHDGVPTDPYHPRRVALNAAEAALACQSQGVPVAWQVRRADGRIDGVPIQWECCTKELYETTLATGRYAGYENGPLCEVRALFAAAPAPVSAPSPDREQVGEALGLSYQSCALLLNVLWHHQGGSSTVGQPIRTMLGIGQYDHLTEEQLSEAKRIEGMLAWHEAPDALPFRECGEKKPAGPADQAIYQAIADNYTRESAELGRPLSDFERVVLEYIAFNDGFINTRIRARQMLDGVGGERQGAALSDDARECLQDVVSHYGNFVEALTCKRDTVTTKTDREYWQHELSANARMKRQAEHALAASAPTLGEIDWREKFFAEQRARMELEAALHLVVEDKPQPQAAEPKGMTDEQPSFTNPLTPYGMLVRALRIVVGTTLYDMAKALLTTPAKLSAMEFGRAPVTQKVAFDVSAYFDALGVPDTLSALTVAANARAILAKGE